MRTLLAMALMSTWGLASFARGQACSAYPTTLSNGTTADATQVMADFNCAALTGAARFTGNVGVATTSPQALVDLGSGITTVKLAVWGSGGLTYGMGVNNGELTFGANIPATGTPQMVLTQNGYVGIGTTDPSLGGQFTSSLTVLSPAATAIGAGYNASTPAFALNPQANGSWQIFDHVAGWHTDLAGVNGNVGVGTTTPSYTLHVNGTAYAVGAAGALSDARHKDKIERFPAGALKLVEKLKPVTFVWKDPKDDGMRGEQIGFIAQEMQRILPSVVLTQDNAERTLGIKYNEIIPVLTAAIQEQQAEILALKREVASLRASR